MNFQRSKVSRQIKLLVDQLIREQHIEVRSDARTKLERKLARIVYDYIDDYDALDERVHIFLGEHDLDIEDYYKRIQRNLADEHEIPLDSDALDRLNEEIEEALWDDDGVLELYADRRTLVALVTPYLKAMKR